MWKRINAASEKERGKTTQTKKSVIYTEKNSLAITTITQVNIGVPRISSAI